jgi:hypothetical protein
MVKELPLVLQLIITGQNALVTCVSIIPRHGSRACTDRESDWWYLGRATAPQVSALLSLAVKVNDSSHSSCLYASLRN